MALNNLEVQNYHIDTERIVRPHPKNNLLTRLRVVSPLPLAFLISFCGTPDNISSPVNLPLLIPTPMATRLQETDRYLAGFLVETNRDLSTGVLTRRYSTRDGILVMVYSSDNKTQIDKRAWSWINWDDISEKDRENVIFFLENQINKPYVFSDDANPVDVQITSEAFDLLKITDPLSYAKLLSYRMRISFVDRGTFGINRVDPDGNIDQPPAVYLPSAFYYQGFLPREDCPVMFPKTF